MRFLRLLLLLTVLLPLFWSPLHAEEPRDSVPEQQAEVSEPSPSSPKVTPVDIDDEKPRVVLHYFDKHGNPLDEPVMFLAVLDTVQKTSSGPVYPRYNGVNLGLDFGDLIFLAFGQRYGSYGIRSNVSLMNWLLPTIECGLGYAHNYQDDSKATFNVKPGFYAKLGIDYNFLYKSSPDYQLCLGIRGGMSHFRYDVADKPAVADAESGTVKRVSFTGQPATCWYGEVLARLQVRIVGNFSLGWSACYHYKFHTTETQGVTPGFVPGYGASSRFAMTVSAIWTIPPATKK